MTAIKVSLDNLEYISSDLQYIKGSIGEINNKIGNIKNTTAYEIQERCDIGNRLVCIKDKLRNIEYSLSKMQEVIEFSVAKYMEAEKVIIEQSEEIILR